MQQEKMNRTKYYQISLFVISSVALWSKADAAQIQNLSQQPQTIEIFDYNQSVTRTLAVGEIFYRPGRINVRWHDREVTIDYDEEFAIWNNDTFGPQRRARRNSGSGF